VGAAVREVHRGCRSVFDRCFGLTPVLQQAEGSQVTLQKPVSPARCRLVGPVGDAPAVTGRVTHAGWQVSQCELPRFQGDPSVANIVAPAEVEVR
jgi:hypothetical protein